MSAQAKPSEPSMEEILASIRRIISDDEVKPAEAQPVAAVPPLPAQDGELKASPVAVAPSPDPVIEDDVLDLGAEASLVAPSAPMPAAPSLSSDIDSGDIDFVDHEEPVAPSPAPTAVAQPPVTAPMSGLATSAPAAAVAAAPNAFDMAQLLSDQASSSVTSAFGQLAHTVLSNNARTLEDLVKDMLKPMLKSWLDDNLPTMVERLVRAEIERVARGGRS